MTKMTKNLKLTIELVPSTSWGDNLRKILPTATWQKVSREVIKHSNGICEICGKKGKLHCHEVWDYDDENHIQSLNELQAICTMCHMVKHFGYATLKSEIPKEMLIKHFMNVNKCSKSDFISYLEEQTNVFNERSKHEWKIEVSIK
jgi:hypothetical protein